jgi:type II secretory pathway pseudopilin PulG
MKHKMTRVPSAFSRTELIVVILIVAVLVAILLTTALSNSSKADRMWCNNNFKEIGTCYRLWASDHGGLLPCEQTVESNGWRDFLTNADTGGMVWTNYWIMQNDLGQSPKLLVCPADERKAAASFTNILDNTHVSYFVGVSASDLYPQSIAGGDRNLGPGTKPDPDYGYSPKSGKGNDVAIPITGPVSWSLKMHSAGNSAGAGNILLGDGSAQQCNSTSINKAWLRDAPPTTNWPAGHIPATPSIRLVFP